LVGGAVGEHDDMLEEVKSQYSGASVPSRAAAMRVGSVALLL